MKYKTIKNFKNKLQNSDNNEFVDLLFDFIKEEGKTNYDESVTQLQHSLQTASLARIEDGRRHIVIASLLHDIGHLLIDENDSKNDFLKKDLNHENIASNFLKDFFSEEITESIRLHVVAKRYLCSIDNSYYERLAKSSKKSFVVQGGALEKKEIIELENNIYFKDAIQLRKWDDRAKVSLKEVEELDTYKEMIVAERFANH
jgi:predicted HD phosphohydrolase